MTREPTKGTQTPSEHWAIYGQPGVEQRVVDGCQQNNQTAGRPCQLETTRWKTAIALLICAMAAGCVAEEFNDQARGWVDDEQTAVSQPLCLSGPAFPSCFGNCGSLACSDAFPDVCCGCDEGCEARGDCCCGIADARAADRSLRGLSGRAGRRWGKTDLGGDTNQELPGAQRGLPGGTTAIGSARHRPAVVRGPKKEKAPRENVEKTRRL